MIQAQALSGLWAQIRGSRELVPICAACERVRDERGNWHRMAPGVLTQAEIPFSHGICPTCLQRLYPEYYPGADEDGTQS